MGIESGSNAANRRRDVDIDSYVGKGEKRGRWNTWEVANILSLFFCSYSGHVLVQKYRREDAMFCVF